jgi:hypothetical protein
MSSPNSTNDALERAADRIVEAIDDNAFMLAASQRFFQLRSANLEGSIEAQAEAAFKETEVFISILNRSPKESH